MCDAFTILNCILASNIHTENLFVSATVDTSSTSNRLSFFHMWISVNLHPFHSNLFTCRTTTFKGTYHRFSNNPLSIDIISIHGDVMIFYWKKYIGMILPSACFSSLHIGRETGKKISFGRISDGYISIGCHNDTLSVTQLHEL